MRATRRTKALLVAAAIGGASLLGGAAPATADCVSADLSYRALGGTEQYVIGPKKCLVSTPWAELVDAGAPAGTPSVLEVEANIWVPAPVAKRPPAPAP